MPALVQIIICTSNLPNASSTALAWIKLVGEFGSSERMQLLADDAVEGNCYLLGSQDGAQLFKPGTEVSFLYKLKYLGE